MASAATEFVLLSTEIWHTVEMQINIDEGVGNDGTIAWWLDGVAGTTLVAGQPGDRFTFEVGFQDCKQHLPIVLLKRAA